MSINKLLLLLAVVVATFNSAATAHAQNARTWVSATNGTNNAECSRTQPCQTFAQAIAVTNSGGEINCLTAGGFGPVSISKPVTLDCEGVSNGGISLSGGTAIDINGTTGPVNLIGLDINGDAIGGANGGTGIGIFSNAVVNIRNCKIYGFTGISGFAIYFTPSSSGGVLVVDNVLIADNGIGIWLLSAHGASNMTVRNSAIVNNSAVGIQVYNAGGTHAGATIEQTTLAFHSAYEALFVYGAGAVVLIGGSTVVNNTVGVLAQSGGAIYSFKNNQIGGNGTDGTPLTAYPGGPLN